MTNQPLQSEDATLKTAMDSDVTPQRIQLSRAKGWRMPENTVKVDRTTKWGNPFVIASDRGPSGRHWPTDPATSVSLFRKLLDTEGAWCPVPVPKWPKGKIPAQWTTVDQVRAELRGKNLACWCKLGEPCHADVLLELANPELAAASLSDQVGRTQ